MQVHVVVAPVFATNCCIVVDQDGAPGSDAVIVDPGAGVTAAVNALVAERHWKVRAVLATHGHVDHTWDGADLCRKYGVPFRIHQADEYRLADPFGSLSTPPGQTGKSPAGELVVEAMRAGLSAIGVSPEGYRTPTPVVTFGEEGDDGLGRLQAADLRLRLIHAPGHTEGATVYLTEDLVLSGDVLFAGSIGRTDLPGGDPQVMRDSLRSLRAQLATNLGVVPGHGLTTTVERELLSNPYFG